VADARVFKGENISSKYQEKWKLVLMKG